jgi:hypothetical protein
MHTADDVYSDAIMALRLAFEHVSALKSPDDSARDQQTVRSRINLGSTSERFS